MGERAVYLTTFHDEFPADQVAKPVPGFFVRFISKWRKGFPDERWRLVLKSLPVDPSTQPKGR